MEIEEGKLHGLRYKTLKEKLARAGKNTRYQTNSFEFGLNIGAAKMGVEIEIIEVTTKTSTGEPVL